MLTCETVEALVIREVDGLLTETERVDVDEHVGRCDGCRARREANLAVAHALARRVDAPVPPGFARRVSERLSPGASEGWLPAIDWRRWTEWMLPVAAALVLVAAMAGRGATISDGTGQASTTDSTTQAIDAWEWLTGGDATTEVATITADVTNEELLEAMLVARATSGGGKRDGR